MMDMEIRATRDTEYGHVWAVLIVPEEGAVDFDRARQLLGQELDRKAEQLKPQPTVIGKKIVSVEGDGCGGDLVVTVEDGTQLVAQYVEGSVSYEAPQEQES